MEGYITIRDAAEKLGVTEKTIRNRIKSGDLPAEKKEGINGPQYFIPAQAVTEPPKTIVDVVKVPKHISVTQVVEIIRSQVQEDFQKLETRMEAASELGQEIQDEMENIHQDMIDLHSSMKEMMNQMQQTIDQLASNQEKKKRSILDIFRSK